MNDFKVTGIELPHDNDVLLGRGNYVNGHPGNRRFRVYVQMQRELYFATPKSDKPLFAKMIVGTIRNLVPPGRFLKKDRATKLWSDVGDRKAWDKTRQALREKSISIADTTKTEILPPVDESPKVVELMPKRTPLAIAASDKLRTIFTRQMEVAAIYTQSPIEPSTRCSARWATDFPLSPDDVDQLDAKNVEHDKLLVTNDAKQVHVNDVASEDSETFMHDHDGKAFMLKKSFTAEDSKTITQDAGIPQIMSEEEYGLTSLHSSRSSNERRSSLKCNPKYSDTVLKFNSPSDGDVSSSVTISNPPSFTSVSGVRFDSAINSDSVFKFNSPSVGDVSSSVTTSTPPSFTSVSGVRFDSAINCSSNPISNAKISDDEDIPKLEDRQFSGFVDVKSTQMGNRGLKEEKFSGLIDARHLTRALMMEQGKQISGLTNSITSDSSMSDLQCSLLRASLLTCERNDDDHNSGQVKEDGKRTSLDNTKIEDIMTPRNRRHSLMLSQRSLNSVSSNLSDLSYPSGRMSILENMSLGDSGIFSMSESQLTDWQKEAADWEKEEDMKENQDMQDLQLNQDYGEESHYRNDMMPICDMQLV